MLRTNHPLSGLEAGPARTAQPGTVRTAIPTIARCCRTLPQAGLRGLGGQKIPKGVIWGGDRCAAAGCGAGHRANAATFDGASR